MATDARWRAAARVANLVGIVVALGALVLLGYFASLGIQVMRASGV